VKHFLQVFQRRVLREIFERNGGTREQESGENYIMRS
jgi:hypothetical protein